MEHCNCNETRNITMFYNMNVESHKLLFTRRGAKIGQNNPWQHSWT